MSQPPLNGQVASGVLPAPTMEDKNYVKLFKAFNRLFHESADPEDYNTYSAMCFALDVQPLVGEAYDWQLKPNGPHKQTSGAVLDTEVEFKKRMSEKKEREAAQAREAQAQKDELKQKEAEQQQQSANLIAKLIKVIDHAREHDVRVWRPLQSLIDSKQVFTFIFLSFYPGVEVSHSWVLIFLAP